MDYVSAIASCNIITINKYLHHHREQHGTVQTRFYKTRLPRLLQETAHGLSNVTDFNTLFNSLLFQIIFLPINFTNLNLYGWGALITVRGLPDLPGVSRGWGIRGGACEILADLQGVLAGRIILKDGNSRVTGRPGYYTNRARGRERE